MEELKGIIIFQLSNKGSKSEAVLPFLYQNKDSIISIFKEGDNPFENNELNKYDGKAVTVKGEKKDNYFVISEITVDYPNVTEKESEE